MHHPRALALSVLATAALFLAGCTGPYSPGGAVASSDTATYISTAHSPKTITVLDTRTGQAVWSLELPVGQQLTLQFIQGKGEDPVYLEDLMRYEIFDEPTTWGNLPNEISVPGRYARRVTVELRPGPEFAPADG